MAVIEGKGEEDSMIIIVPVALITLLLTWGVTTYNRLVTERLKVQTQWSQIDVALRQRFDLIPNLVETIKGYTAHEKEALQAATDVRSRCLSAGDAREQMKASTELSGAMSHLMMMAEYYPGLKTDQNFLYLQQQISAMEEKLANYRQFYSDTILCYNGLLVAVPTDLITGLFHSQEEEFFKAEEAEEAVITVRF